MKTKKISLMLLISVIAICIIALIGITAFGSQLLQVANATDEEVEEPNYDEYTDSDTLLNGSNTIRDYANTLHHSTVSWNGSHYTVNDDDPIVQIVPKDLFQNEGEYLYIGKEYGFFVKTVADSSHSIHTSNQYVDPYNKHVEVLVFDITTNTDIKNQETADLITVKVEPLFQYRYAYIDYKSSTFYSDNNAVGSNTFVLHYDIPDGSAYVVPKPLTQDRNSFSQTWNYFLKDVSIGSTLYNEQDLNEEDDGYEAMNDNGYFFTQFDYKYDGFVSEVSAEDKLSMGLNVVGMICGVAGFIPGPVGMTAGVLGLILSGAQSAEDISIVSENGISDKSVSNGQVTATNRFTTKADQVANYTNPQTGAACLTKNATCLVKGDDNHGNVWFAQGDHATGYFRVSHTQDLHTRLEREIGLSVVEKSGVTHKEKTCSKYKFMINEPKYKSIDLDDNIKLHLLTDGNNYFIYTPSYTSDYKFTFSNNETADVYVTANNSPVTANEDGKTYRMNGGVMYMIRIHRAKKGTFNVNISPSSTANDINANGEYLIKYTPTSAGAYNLAVSNTSFTIKKAYENRDKYAYSSIKDVGRALDCANFEAVLKEGGTYYLLLKNTSSATVSCEINATKCNTSLRIGSNASRNITGGKNHVYYEFSFSNGNNGNRDISFCFVGVENTNVKADFIVFDEKGDLVEITDQCYEGFLKLNNLSVTSTYYIGVRTVETVTLSCQVHDTEVMYKWKELINGAWQDVQLTDGKAVVYRGETHYYSYWHGETQIHHYHLDCDKNQDYEEGVKFIDHEYKLITGKDAYDNVVVYLHGKEYSEANPEGRLLNNALNIRIMFNKNEVQTTFSVNYDNTIKPTLQVNGGKFDRVNYVLKSNANNSDVMSTIEASVIEKGKSFSKDIFDTLCNRKATKASIIITNVVFKSGEGNKATRDETLNWEYRINCYNKLYKPQEMASYISNELHFYNMRYSADNIKYLANDITLRHFANWEVIPYNSVSKTIDGNWHTVYGMRFSVPTGSQKLYGFIGENQGTIKNLNFSGVSITGKSSDKYGEMRFGTVAAINSGKIYNCNASGRIDVYRKDGVVGGIVAINNKSALVQDCVFGYEGSQSTNYIGNSGDIGGIAGRNMGGIQFCRTLNTTIGGDIDHCESSYGGIAGYTDGGVIVSSGASGVTIKVTNGSLISGYYPKMGYVVGHLANNAFMDRCTVSDCGNDIKKLTVGYRKYCFKGPSGSYGKCDNSKVTNM